MSQKIRPRRVCVGGGIGSAERTRIALFAPPHFFYEKVGRGYSMRFLVEAVHKNDRPLPAFSHATQIKDSMVLYNLSNESR